MNIIMYGQPNCSGCNDVKTMLKAKAIEYMYIDVSNEEGYIAYSSDFPGNKTVPTMLIDDTKLVGGNAIVKYLSTLE